jgi:hypothetical protein
LARCCFIGAFVDEEAHPHFGFIGPDVAFESTETQQIETVESKVVVMAFADMSSEHAGTGIVRRCSGKFASVEVLI